MNFVHKICIYSYYKKKTSSIVVNTILKLFHNNARCPAPGILPFKGKFETIVSNLHRCRASTSPFAREASCIFDAG